MRIPLPQSRARRIAERARQLAVLFGQKKGWESSDDIEIVSGDGKVGLRPQHKYLLYQNYGTKPRDMVELEGKTIPMKDESGGVRFVKVKGVGQPGTVTLPGGVKVYKEKKWHHPGIKPTHFLEKALDQAIEEDRQRSGVFRKVWRRVAGGQEIYTPKQRRRF